MKVSAINKKTKSQKKRKSINRNVKVKKYPYPNLNNQATCFNSNRKPNLLDKSFQTKYCLKFLVEKMRQIGSFS